MRLLAAVLLAAAAAGPVAPGQVPRGAPHPAKHATRLLLRARLAEPPRLVDLQGRAFPGFALPASPIRVGSVFSGLWRGLRDPAGVFWGVMDRGPNDEQVVDGETRRVFLLPEYGPALVRLRLSDSAQGPRVVVDQALHLKTPAGRRVSGLPNRADRDEAPYDASGRTRLGFDPNGLDAEGLVRDADGSFWLAEEYGPSLLRVAADGTIRVRYLPHGSGVTGLAYPAQETLPAILTRRRQNRGFEGLALSGDGKTLYALVQSPLANPDRAAADASRLLRILAVDAGSGRPTAEHVMLLDEAAAYGETRQSEVRIGDVAWVNPTTLLVVEEIEHAARVLLLDLARATNILGSAWDDPGSVPSLEQLTPGELAARKLEPVARTLVADLNQVAGELPEKIEGLAIVDAFTLAVGNDNEYAVRGKRPPSELLLVRLAHPLPLAAGADAAR